VCVEPFESVVIIGPRVVRVLGVHPPVELFVKSLEVNEVVVPVTVEVNELVAELGRVVENSARVWLRLLVLEVTKLSEREKTLSDETPAIVEDSIVAFELNRRGLSRACPFAVAFASSWSEFFASAHIQPQCPTASVVKTSPRRI
jgi:hypothetical protein